VPVEHQGITITYEFSDTPGITIIMILLGWYTQFVIDREYLNIGKHQLRSITASGYLGVASIKWDVACKCEFSIDKFMER
jgi:hypothetical protein